MRLALDQWTPVASKTEGIARLHDSAAKAAALQADILILPEMALTGYNIGPEAVRAAAEPKDGPMVQALAAAAQKHRIAIVAGLPERAGPHVYNTAHMIGPGGATLAHYRKTHLFGLVDRSQFSPGQTLSPVFAYKGWNLAIAICYDVEFPELVRTLALQGAEALLVPTANMEPYRGIPLRAVPVRAEENEIFVAYANYTGPEHDFTYCGLSCVCGPDGNDLARAGHEAEMIVADLSRDHFTATRHKISHLNDRRTDLYPGD